MDFEMDPNRRTADSAAQTAQERPHFLPFICPVSVKIQSSVWIDQSIGSISNVEIKPKDGPNGAAWAWICLVTDKESNKPRGYAFIEYMHTQDMKAAYKQADGKKLDNIRVLVDVERGRTVTNWRSRRLGGGLGTTRVGGEDVNQKYSGRVCNWLPDDLKEEYLHSVKVVEKAVLRARRHQVLSQITL
ncbi:hypothetical protein HYC85_012793 [Camellia sinensis]|uniref:U1 small nuclear ribonucleoprotein 70 kDa n=1 Tax=Camellia sinensis TaxID=4442 RepID=A0A7J7HD08_CAMSI|nr:hypothetical protein HYC85_012793 [Camellia sinensis]